MGKYAEAARKFVANLPTPDGPRSNPTRDHKRKVKPRRPRVKPPRGLPPQGPNWWLPRGTRNGPDMPA